MIQFLLILSNKTPKHISFQKGASRPSWSKEECGVCDTPNPSWALLLALPAPSPQREQLPRPQCSAFSSPCSVMGKDKIKTGTESHLMPLSIHH